MAQVFLAVHQDVPNLKVVLKVLSDARLVERFKQEADKLALLDGHGHICQIKHFFNHGDNIVIAMEFIDGSSLDELILKESTFPVEQSINIIASVLETLAFAHKKGIYHRDIKPGNIMVDKTGQVKIIDFGIAKGETDPNLTVTGSSCGTPTYMPPEQFNPTEDINYALADIYATGTTLYYMLTGELPFKGDNAFALRDAKLFNEPTPPRKLNKDIPQTLEDIVLKSISRQPEDRFESVDQMSGSLRLLIPESPPIIATQATFDSKISLDAKRPEPTHAKKKTRLILPAAIIGILTAIIIYFVFISGEDTAQIEPPTLSYPANGAIMAHGLPLFEWETKIIGGSFTLEIANDTNFGEPRVMPRLSENNYAPEMDLAEGTYFWRVKAVDADGNLSDYSAIRMLTIEIPVDIVLNNGILALAINPSGNIFINGKSYGQNKKSIDIELAPGQYELKIENLRSVQKRYVDSITIVSDENVNRSFSFTFPATKPEKTYGEIRVGSKPIIGALVFIDGVVQERKTNTSFRLETGRHIVKAILTFNDREIEKTDTVYVENGGSHKLIFDFEN